MVQGFKLWKRESLPCVGVSEVIKEVSGKCKHWQTVFEIEEP